MTHEEFDKLVQRVESGIGRDTKALYRRIFRLAVMGYAGLAMPLILVVVIGLAFLIPGIIWPRDATAGLILGAVILTFGGWAAGSTLWTRMVPPVGRAVKREEAPELLAALDGIRTKLRSAPFDQVLVIPAFNAAFSHCPRLGVFGWNRTYLLCGLPLMETLSEDEFIAVLAHECAHLSRRHHRSGQWVYRLRRSWEQVFARLARPHPAGTISFEPVTRKFIGWFWPQFNACAFVLSRAHEYQADATAAEIAGVGNMAAALLRIRWLSRVLEDKLWPDIWQGAGANSAPPDGVFARIAHSLNAITADSGAKALEQAFNAPTTNADTHPCLSDRLRALGGAELVAASRQSAGARKSRSAAEALLGSSLTRIRADVEENWRQEVAARWSQMHGRANVLHDRLGKLDAAVETSKADLDAIWDKARVFLELQQPESAAPFLRQILAAAPGHTAANYNLGVFLLNSGSAEGEPLMERALAENEELLPQAANILQGYYRQAGMSDRIKELYVRLDRHEQDVKASAKERSNVSARDRFIPHELTEAEHQALLKILSGESEIIRAHLAQKELLHFKKQRLYLLCVQTRPAWHRIPNPTRAQAVVNRLIPKVHLPGRVLIFSPSGDFRVIAKRLREVASSQIY